MIEYFEALKIDPDAKLKKKGKIETLDGMKFVKYEYIRDSMGDEDIICQVYSITTNVKTASKTAKLKKFANQFS
jgi:hypothetical protein